jgi:hypothetical protein
VLYVEALVVVVGWQLVGSSWSRAEAGTELPAAWNLGSTLSEE